MPDWHRCNDPDCKYPDCDCWERKEHTPLLERHKQLGAFYGTDDYASLVDAQHRQIKKLQEKLRAFHPVDAGRPNMTRA